MEVHRQTATARYHSPYLNNDGGLRVREIATTLTDFLLALFSLMCASNLWRRSGATHAHGPIIFFMGFALATLFGGLWHGFFGAPGTNGERFIWWLSTVFAGLSATGLALTGVEALRQRHRVIPWAAPTFAAAFAVYVWFDTRFLAVLVVNACATLVCIFGMLYRLRRGQAVAASMVLCALAISILAGISQQYGIAIHPRNFDYNATYHVLLLPALGLFYAGICRIED